MANKIKKIGKLTAVSIILTILFIPCPGFAAIAVDGPALSVESVSTSAGGSIVVSVTSDSAKVFNAAQFTLKFDGDLLTVSSVSAGSADRTWALVNNPKNPGKLIVAMFNASGVTPGVSGHNSQLAVIKFAVNSHPKSSVKNTKLTLSNVIFDAITVTKLKEGTFSL